MVGVLVAVGVLLGAGVLVAVGVTVGVEVSVGVGVMVGVVVAVGVLVAVGVAVVENLFATMGRYICPSLVSSSEVVLSSSTRCSPCETPCTYLAPSRELSGFNDVRDSAKKR